MMKVLHIGQMIGGLDVYIRNSISSASGDIDYVIMHGKDDKAQPVFSKGVEVKEYKTNLQRNLSLRHDIKTLWQAVNIIRKEKPDIIHCHSAKGGIVGRVAGFLTHTKVLYTPHGFSFLCSPKTKVRSVYKMIERVTRLGAWMLACGESEQQLGMSEVGYNRKKALCWHNCVPITKAPESYRPKDNYITIIGRPSYQKNPFFLIEVIRKVHDTHPNLKFHLLGVGYYSPDLDEMKRMIDEYHLHDTILLSDWLDHDTTMKLVGNSLLYLTVSRYEGLPLAVVEAMGMGKCIVASNVVGNVDCIQDGVNGRLLPLEVEKFADALCELLDNPERIEEYGIQSRRLYEGNFDIGKRIGLLEEIYHKIAGK